MRVCLFDIDGTLLFSGGAGKAAIESALTEEFEVSLRGQVPYSGRTDRAIARDLFQLHDIEENQENWQILLGGYLKRLPTCLSAHNGRVLPGVAPFLDRLRRADTAIGLLTGNVRDGARLKLEHYGLFRYFAFGGYGDHHLDRDDVARESLAAAHDHLNGRVSLDDIWVIGDTPHDVRCARAIGVRVAAVATGWHSLDELQAAQPDVLLADLREPEPLLQRWR